jgi:UDP-N-acetylglucosamine/UDP-N-acetylgalactosamine 4-epimerase
MSIKLKDKKILVTGGAGFIGSNLVEALLNAGAFVTVFDNLETGKKKNIEQFFSNSRFNFIEGDLRNEKDCLNAVKGIDLISHQAALGSVPRSIEFPHNTHAVNATGFLNMLHAAKEEGIKRFVYASSSSVYGDSNISPKVVGTEGNLLSPYAVTKQLNEQYAKVYARLHGMETIGLRYFNVFGPKQDPYGVYAAAIPKFIDKMMNGEEIVINGDGEQTRDFTYVLNAVNANILGLTADNNAAYGGVYNVACGEYYSLNNVINEIKQNLQEFGKFNDNSTIVHGPNRPGDVRDSLADITNTKVDLGYINPVSFNAGMTDYLKSMFS